MTSDTTGDPPSKAGADPTCEKCDGKGWYLYVYPRPGGPDGNARVECPCNPRAAVHRVPGDPPSGGIPEPTDETRKMDLKAEHDRFEGLRDNALAPLTVEYIIELFRLVAAERRKLEKADCERFDAHDREMELIRQNGLATAERDAERRQKIDELECTLEDEEAGHQETLGLWKATRAALAASEQRVAALTTAWQEHSRWDTCDKWGDYGAWLSSKQQIDALLAPPSEGAS